MALPACRYGVTKGQLNKINNLPVNTIGMIEEALETSEEYTDDAIGWGSRNILNADVLFASASHHGISLSISNQIISLSGTVSGDVGYYFGNINNTLVLPAGTYTFSIVCNGSFGTTSEIRLRKKSDSSRIVGILTNDIKPVSFTLDTDTEIFIAIVNSTAPIDTFVNATLKIQLEKGSTATYYELYHASVAESLDEKSDISALGTHEGETASRLYHSGEHFYKDGKFCTVTSNSDVAAGSTWTLNTNYVVGSLSDFIVKKYTKTVTVAAGGLVEVTIPQITDYTVIEVTPTGTGTGVWASFNPIVFYGAGYVNSVVVRNNDANDAHTWDIYLYVIYAKTNTVVQETLT